MSIVRNGSHRSRDVANLSRGDLVRMRVCSTRPERSDTIEIRRSRSRSKCLGFPKHLNAGGSADVIASRDVRARPSWHPPYLYTYVYCNSDLTSSSHILGRFEQFSMSEHTSLGHLSWRER